MAELILSIFIAGYFAIVFENAININKAAVALVTGVLCWVVYIIFSKDETVVAGQLSFHLGEISQILFFLMGAMTIVELIDAHDGFEIITQQITTTSKTKLLWIIGITSFLLSTVLNNLTTAIVMISMIRKIVDDKNDRWMLTGLIIIAANAGGAWSPVGDVTTTMLWIGGQISASNIILKLIIPSLVCLIIPLLVMNISFKGQLKTIRKNFTVASTSAERKIIFYSGIAVLLMVPVFRTITHLPPFMGMLIGLGIVWIITEIINSGKEEKDKRNYTVAYALRKIDSPSILFFLGILLSISVLQSIGQLAHIAQWMDANLKNENIIAGSIGLLSSVVDNVPLVAATQGMYDLNVFPVDHNFWGFLTYATGTGGSIFIIGSAAGIAAMGMEKINFFWYLKRISWLALLGYIAGALVYTLQNKFFGQ